MALGSAVLTGTQSTTFNRSFDTLIDTFKDVKGGSANKSLRVYENPKSKGEFLTKVHSGISFFGSSKEVRAEKRESAVKVVTNAIAQKFGCSKEVAKGLLEHVRGGKGSDRVTVSDLRKIAAQGQEYVASMNRLGDFIADLKTPGPLKEPKPFALTKEDVSLFMEHPTIKEHIEGIKAGNVESLRKMDDLLKDLGMSTSWNNPYGTGSFTKYKEQRSAIIEPLTQAKNLAVSQYLAKASDVLPKITVGGTSKQPLFEQPSIESFKQKQYGDLVQGENTWKMSSSGTNGAVIVKGGELPCGGMVLKVEEKKNAEVQLQIVSYMNAVREMLPQGLPVEGMILKEVKVQQKDLGNMYDLVNQGMVDDPKRMGGVKGKLDGIDEGQTVLTAAMFIENSSDVDKLGIKDKKQLMESKEFPNSVGQALVLSRLFGLNDHVAVAGGGETNFSNLMINNDTGRLVFIDLSGSKVESNVLLENFSSLVECATKFANGELSYLDMKGNGPMSNIYQNVFETSYQGSLFSPLEKSELGKIGEGVRQKFMGNVLLGVVDAMLLVAQNQNAFLNGEPMFNDKELVIGTIGKMQGQLEDLQQRLHSL